MIFNNSYLTQLDRKHNVGQDKQASVLNSVADCYLFKNEITERAE